MSKFANEGDWLCPDENCQNLNFARRTECNRCGAEKPMGRAAGGKRGGFEIGKAAAEKSKGLFSADDWMCPKCGNVNWSRRSTCNVCNAPKQGEEERTGLGGGYNEREDVEYKERDDSDGEYDEFGRRKKKFRKPDADAPNSEIQVERKKIPAEEAEEEDDEDDEDGDLSKYDLWGSDDDGDENEKVEEKVEKKGKEDPVEKKLKEEKDEKKGKEEKESKDKKEKKDRDDRSDSSSSRHKPRRSSSSSSDDDRRRYRSSKGRDSRGSKRRSKSRSRSRSRSRDRRRRR